jgi:pimeloyl-ACP methyl ester carboxylesterase
VAGQLISPRLDGSVAVHDDRRIGFAEFGSSNGPVVFSFHAGMSSRLDAAWADAAARSQGVRVIALDRPGIGRSGPQPDRRLLDWPNDVAAVADNLGIDRFAVVGWSSGGVYALACAAAIPERVSRVGVIASLAPIGVRPMTGFDRGFLVLARRAPLVVRSLSAVIVIALRIMMARGSVMRGAARVVGAADGEVVAGLGPKALVPFREAFRSGSQGVIDDERIVIEPWGFALEDIESEVHLWQGDADRFAPPANARVQAERLPRGVLHPCPGEGHFLAYAHAAEILRTLTSQSVAKELS